MPKEKKFKDTCIHCEYSERKLLSEVNGFHGINERLICFWDNKKPRLAFVNGIPKHCKRGSGFHDYKMR